MDLVGKQLRQEEEEKVEREADRQLREESIESDQGIEPWMTIGQQTIRQIAEASSPYEGEEYRSEATIRGENPAGKFGKEIDPHEERWIRMEKWVMDYTKEDAEVKKELGRLCALVQEERDERRKLLGEMQELRKETNRARREADEGRGEVKKWLARMGNENKEGERIGAKNLAIIMDSLTALHANHNVSREDHKSIYREITMLETAMGSTVKEAVAEAVGRLRLELKRIFESLAEDTPRPKDLEPESSDSDTGGEEKDVAWRKGYRGTIGGRRGGGTREESGGAGNPINLVTPAKTKATGRVGPKLRSGGTGMVTTAGKLANLTTPVKLKATTESRAPEAEATREPDHTHEADGGRDGSSAGGMPGRWDSSPTVSLDPTPIQGLTSPRRDLVPEEISAVRDEITISHIANEVPMEPELSPEPEEAAPTVTATTRYDKETEEEMLRQVEDESKRQGEAEHRKEEERMLGRVLGTRGKGDGRGGRDGERITEPEEGEDEEAAERGGRGGGLEEKEEKMRKGWCDQCKEECGKKDGTKDTKQVAQKGEEGETRKAAAGATRGNELQREGKESGAIESSD